MKIISPFGRLHLLTTLTMAFALPLNAAVEFAGNLTGVSTYIWRGIKANNGPALQSDAAINYKSVKFGFWGSSVNFGDDIEVETDLYADFSLPTGDVSSSIGITVYMLDFTTFNRYADAEYELNAKIGYGPVGLNAFYVPKQNSTKDQLNGSNYWLEFYSVGTWLGADLSVTIGHGTYASRWMPEGETKDPVSLLLLSAAKGINDDISIFWTFSLDLFNSGFENIFYFGATYSF